ncbi:MAG: hypothetical protein ACTSYA_02590 [Candidatus Kariarchaeaceae archaeon]
MKKHDIVARIRLMLTQHKVLFSNIFSNHWFNLVISFLIISNVKILLGLLINNPFINDDYLWMMGSAELNENFADFAHLGYPPGYLMILSFTWNFVSSPSSAFHLMIIFNAFLSTAIIFPVYLIAKKYFSDNFSLFLAIVSSLFPSTFSYSFTIMAENVFYTFSVFFLYFIIQLFTTNLSHKSILWLIGSAFFFLAAVGTKLVGFCLLVPVVILALDALIRLNLKYKTHQKIINPSFRDVKIFFVALLVITAIIGPTVFMINNNDELVQAVWPQEGDGYFDEMETLFSLNDTLNSSIHNFELLGRIYAGHLGYAVIALSFTGVFLALIPLLFPASKFSPLLKKDEKQSSTANEFQFTLASWAFFAALVVLSTFHGLYVALNPTLVDLFDGEFADIYLQDLLYGRYISASFPLLLISAALGFRRMNQVQGKTKIIPFSILSSIFIISLVFMPFPMWSVSNNLEMSGYRIFVFLFDGLTFLVQMLFFIAALLSFSWIVCHHRLPKRITHVFVTLSLLMILLSTFSAFLIIKQRADSESVFLEPGLWLEANDPTNDSVIIRSYGGGFYQRTNEKYVIDRVTRGVEFYSNNHFQIMNFDWYLAHYPAYFTNYNYVITLNQLPSSIESSFNLLMNITITKDQLDSARSYDVIVGGEESHDLFILFYILK